MSIAHNQFRTFQRQLEALSPDIGHPVDLAARIENLIRHERAAGSRDRRLYRELHYTYLRNLPWLSQFEGDKLALALASLCAELPATRAFRAALLVEAPDAGAGLSAPNPSELLPAWLRAECPEAFEPALAACLATRASLWLRLEAGHQDCVTKELDALGWTWSASPLLPTALCIQGERDLTQLESYAKGLFEVQDLGSQLILASQSIPAGGRWLDACAGAGGKTLQLAGLLGPASELEAKDIRLHALEELVHRARRAGLQVSGFQAPAPTGPGSFRPKSSGAAARKGQNSAPISAPVRTDAASIKIVATPSGLYDGILIDAPCSGSGTWRRAPQLKWSTQPDGIAHDVALQRELLDQHAPFVAPGGLLLYATCSLCRSENEALLQTFLETHLDFVPVPSALASAGLPGHSDLGLRILPHLHDTDGFYICALRRQES